MIKYVISLYENPLVILKTRADAEEFMLSIAEENAFEGFNFDMNYENEKYIGYFSSWQFFDYYNIKSNEAKLLLLGLKGYSLDEVVEVE